MIRHLNGAIKIVFDFRYDTHRWFVNEQRYNFRPSCLYLENEASQ
jgi:hypothetical protein